MHICNFYFLNVYYMEMIENGFAINTAENERGNYTVGQKYEIKDWMISDDWWSTTNFSNVRKWFRKSK